MIGVYIFKDPESNRLSYKVQFLGEKPTESMFLAMATKLAKMLGSSTRDKIRHFVTLSSLYSKLAWDEIESVRRTFFDIGFSNILYAEDASGEIIVKGEWDETLSDEIKTAALIIAIGALATHLNSQHRALLLDELDA